ncbi:MAG: LysM peptidoglycan-binding domain-containing protein [Lentisphaerae bacterium]|nr:LysM peptidoglycan-binding domain-containing protein [Lentisphaerota bacterium]
MKASALLVVVVVALHCAAIGALFFTQGCGTLTRTTPAATSSMPPTTKEAVSYPPPSAKPAAAEPAPTDLSMTKEITEYIVRPGDTLSGIAKQYGISSSEIIALNKLANPNKLYAGQKLELPGLLKVLPAPAKPSAKSKVIKPVTSASAPVAAPAEPTIGWPMEAVTKTTLAAGNEYVVQRGDTLSAIAKKHGTKVSALRDINKLQSDKLKIGQKLIVAQAAAEPAAVTAPAIEAPVAPPAAETTSLAAPAATPVSAVAEPSPAIASSGISHIVQPNEDIISIAKLYAVTVEEIAELNQLDTNRTVQVGQRLIIP